MNFIIGTVMIAARILLLKKQTDEAENVFTQVKIYMRNFLISIFILILKLLRFCKKCVRYGGLNG